MRLLPALSLLFGALARLSAEALPPVEFIQPALESEAPEGHLKFVWEVEGDFPEPLEVVFERAATDAFESPVELYRGRDLGTYVSGLIEGDYYFRVRTISEAASGPWSEAARVRVDYVERGQVIGLMAAGLIVFVITVGAIVGGHLRSGEDLD